MRKLHTPPEVFGNMKINVYKKRRAVARLFTFFNYRRRVIAMRTIRNVVFTRVKRPIYFLKPFG